MLRPHNGRYIISERISRNVNVLGDEMSYQSSSTTPLFTGRLEKNRRQRNG